MIKFKFYTKKIILLNFIILIIFFIIKLLLLSNDDKYYRDKGIILDNPSLINKESIYYLPKRNNSYKIKRYTIIKKSYELSEIEAIVKKHKKIDTMISKNPYKIAIILPYKDRLENLKTFLINMHPFLIKQNVEYTFFLVEPSKNTPFNKVLLTSLPT